MQQHSTAANTPGSASAIAIGCRCAGMDNARGRGYLGGVKDADGNTLYVISADCPLHGECGAQPRTQVIGLEANDAA